MLRKGCVCTSKFYKNNGFDIPGMEYFNTYGGNTVSCAVALAVLDVIEKEKLQENAVKVGDYVLNKFEELKQKNDVIGDVR